MREIFKILLLSINVKLFNEYLIIYFAFNLSKTLLNKKFCNFFFVFEALIYTFNAIKLNVISCYPTLYYFFL